MLFDVDSRPVNSGIRFLLNGLAKNSESADLSFIPAGDCLSADESWMARASRENGRLML
jgi:hypothetical protein